MGGWLTFLFLSLLIVGGAIALTLFAVFMTNKKTRGSSDRSVPELSAKIPASERIEDYFERLQSIEVKIGAVSQLMDYTRSTQAGEGTKAVLERQRAFLDYLVDYADKYCALILKEVYVGEVDGLLSLSGDETWIEESRAFRERLRNIYKGYASRPYLGSHAALDEAFAAIIREYDQILKQLIESRTTRLLRSESPVDRAESLKKEGRLADAALETSLAELDEAFDLFLAEREVEDGGPAA
jgi:hypothetical protein